MDFFNYNITATKKNKRDKLILLVYRKIIDLFSEVIEKYLEPMKYRDIFPQHEKEIIILGETKEMYVLKSKLFRKEFKNYFPSVSSQLLDFILSLGGKINKNLFITEDLSEENKIKNWLYYAFFNDSEKGEEEIKFAYEKYLQHSEKNILEENDIHTSSQILSIYLFPFEKYILKEKEKPQFLLEDGQMVVGSNFDIHNIQSSVKDLFTGTSSPSSLSSCQDNNSDVQANPWFVPVLLISVFLVLAILIVFFYFFFR